MIIVVLLVFIVPHMMTHKIRTAELSAKSVTRGCHASIHIEGTGIPVVVLAILVGLWSVPTKKVLEKPILGKLSV